MWRLYSTADGSLSGALDGVNREFTVQVSINPNTAQVFWNGQLRSGWTANYYDPGETMAIRCLRGVTVRQGLVPPDDILEAGQIYTLPTRDAQTVIMVGAAERYIPGISPDFHGTTITLDEAPAPSDLVVLYA